MDDRLKTCETCLSTDRQLVCLSKLKPLLYEIQLTQFLGTNGGVCWECHGYMVRIQKFRTQVERAQKVLSRNDEYQPTESLSNFSKDLKQYYDFEYTYNYDPLTNASTENVKAEPISMKQEAEDVHFEDIDSDSDEKPLSVIFADKGGKIKNIIKEKKRVTNKSMKQNRKKIKSNLRTKKSNSKKESNGIVLKKEQEINNSKEECLNDEKREKEEILNEKFETIIFSEEEMLKCREEKRNQANFKKIPYNCSSCVTGFIKKENYDLHLKKVHDESIGPHSCSVCQARFAGARALARHRARHYLQYRCRLCAYRGCARAPALAHAQAKHARGAARIHCKQCAFVAGTSEELSEHEKKEHSFSCNECGIKFKGRHTLRTHNSRIHAVKREFTCDVCPRSFVRRSRLEAHQAGHGAAAAQRLAYCGPCRVQYKSIHVYRNHLRNSANHVQERIPCPECDKKFASRVYWTKHYNFYHLRQSQHKCDECDKLFMSRWRLKVHRQTHHGLTRTREHPCTVCSKKFYTKATLASHALLHAAARAFMCAQCGATFRQSAALYTHARLLHRAR